MDWKNRVERYRSRSIIEYIYSNFEEFLLCPPPIISHGVIILVLYTSNFYDIEQIIDLLHNYLQTALWPLVPPSPVLSLLSYERLSKKPLLFKSFTGITVKEFDNLYDKEIVKRYDNHEIKRLSTKSKENRERKYGAIGGNFKLDTKDRFLMLLVYYRLYITYTLTGFLFSLDQSNICRDIQKIEYWILNMVRQCLPIPQKIYNITKRLKTPEEVEKYFPGFMAFIDCT